MESFAVVETTTPPRELERLLAAETADGAVRLVECAESPAGYRWFDVCADGCNVFHAFRSVRTVLHALLDAADRGLVNDFRIVVGADLLHGPLPPQEGRDKSGANPCPT